uniref:Chemokine-like receptor 1 n=1 Tax=Petromyzon marinus TaxID=7757 RepID=A0AAJ7SPU5_PETMA|nr:chemokine-like receptor 1 [Petromyzon marinus]
MTATTHLPSSFFSLKPQSNWNSTDWDSSLITNSTEKPSEISTNLNNFKYVSITVYTIIIILGSVGNFLVIWILGFKMKRTVVTLFFLHLSIADFIFMLQMSLLVVEEAMDGHWAMGMAMCKLTSFGLFMNANASVYFLTLISLDRYAALLHPVSSLPLRRLHMARWLCLAVWLFSFLLSLPPLIFSTTADDNGIIFCFDDYSEDRDEELRHIMAVNICRFVLGFALPYTIMIFCYCHIGAKLQRIDKSRRGNSLKIIVAVVVAFFICWAPYHAIGLMESTFYFHEDHEIHPVAKMALSIVDYLMCFNSCINPILYVFSGSHLKAQFRRSLVAAIENAFRDHEQLDLGQDCGSGPTAQSRDVINLSTKLSSNSSGNTSGNLEGSHGDVVTVGVVQESQV